MKKKLATYDFTILKIFISIVFISTIVSMLLFLISFLGATTIASNGGDIFPNNPRGLLVKISENFIVTDNEAEGTRTFALTDESLIPEDYWCILLDENGDITWSLRKPADIPGHYTLNDIARLTRWFLEDYPVYVRTEDYGLFILGLPKNSVGKYDIEYTMEWFATLPARIMRVFTLNFFAAMLLSSIFGSFLYKKIKLLTQGLVKLRREETVTLPAKGIFKEPFVNINRTSQALAQKNAMLAKRDKARSNWISGISHDIRTPLSMVVGYGEQLSESPELSAENRKSAAIITAQGLKIKKLVEDLNLISSLEYEMQPHNKKPLHISVLLRSVVSELLNSQTIRFLPVPPLAEQQLNSDLTNAPFSVYSPDEYNAHSLPGQEPTEKHIAHIHSEQEATEKYTLSLSLNCEQAVVLGDESLLARAFYNLLQNSIGHNENGCCISVSGDLQDGCVLVVIKDDGQGVPEKVLENLDTLPNTAHGFGLPMAYKIIRAHGGSFHAENQGGFMVTIKLPLM